MRKKLFGGKILQRQEGKLILSPLDIYCDKGQVTEYNPELEYKEINMKGKCILPSFFNMHSHLGESLYFSSFLGDDWNILKYLKYTEQINLGMTKLEKEKFWMQSAIIAAEEMKKEGTIGFCAARSTEIAKKFNLLTMSGYPIMNSSKLIKFKENGIEGFKKFYKKNSTETSSVGIFFHSVYANDKSSFKLALDCIKEGAEFITVHISEDKETYLLENQVHGMSAIKILDKYSLLNERTILVHCGYCTDEDLELIKKRRAIIGICPISNKILNTKMPNLYVLEEKNIPWCICSDGLSTGRTFSLIDQIKEAKKNYPLISIERYFESITSIPGLYYNRNLYSGFIEKGVISSFLIADYEGDNAVELLNGILSGKIKYEFKYL